MSRPFAAFDIDGTLIRWQLYHALADELAKSGHIDKKTFARIKGSRMNWKQRSHVDSFEEYETGLVGLLEQALTTISEAGFEKASLAVMAEYKDQVYMYTRDLIKDLKSQDYLLFAVSASPSLLVGMIAKHYDFDDFGGSIYEVKDGYFTGKVELLKSTAKPDFLRKLVVKHNASWQGSIAVGDSEGDIPMLSIVERPLAFNPTRELFEHAQRSGWRIAVERKNMTYEMEPKNGSYILAETNS
jgi:HAD superfamily hydrolase (TIGR01490 family)